MQYDITDPANPKLTGRVWLGGLIRRDGDVKVRAALVRACCVVGGGG